VGVDVIDRKQLSMVLPVELIEAIKQRARDLGLSITAYVSALVRADLGQPAPADLPELAEQLRQLQVRVEQLERLVGSSVGSVPVDPM
jgi:TolA-binding protein